MKKTFYNWCIENKKTFLLDEWDYDKNNAIGLHVNNVSYGSGKKAYWLCKNNHSYKKAITSITSHNTQCPYCESKYKKLLQGFNDLATTNPELMEEWDYEKNTNIQPNETIASSQVKVWWKCKKCNSSWFASIRQRAKISRGCPYCAHLLPIVGKNDFATLYPALLNDWDYEKNKQSPESYTAYSGTKVFWKCHFCKHEWKSSIHNRTTGKHNCPSCTMKSTSFGEQALYYYIKKIFPDAINRYRNYDIELDVFIPSINLGIEFDGYYWHNNEKSIAREQNKYSVCKANNIKLIRIKDSKAISKNLTADEIYVIDNLQDKKQLKNLIRILMRKLDPASNPNSIYYPHHIWSTIDKEINPEHDRFEILEDKYKRNIENSFPQQYPEILKEWNYEKNQTFNPYAFTKASTIKVWWKCHVCHYDWQAKIVDRTTGHGKCPVCTNTVLKEGTNDFATLFPELLEEWDYESNTNKPNKTINKRHLKIHWICKKCNFKWSATIGDRTRKDKPSGCPNCRTLNASSAKHLKALKRGNITITNPEYLEEWDYEKNDISPTEITFGSGKRVWWKCKFCGHSWFLSPNNRIRKKSKCPKCKQTK